MTLAEQRAAVGAMGRVLGPEVLARVYALYGPEHDALRRPPAVVAIGTSVSSVHIATAIQRRSDLPLSGAALLSGLYGFTPFEERDELYYGDGAHYPDRMPRAALSIRCCRC